MLLEDEEIIEKKEFDDVKDLDYMIIKITDSVLKDREGNIYETTRKYWRVNINKAQCFPYIVSVLNDVVCEVYEVDCWFETKNVNRKGRYEFIGKIAQDSIRNLFINLKYS